MRTADREFRREVRRLVGATGKVCRELTWHEGQSGVRQRHFYEKWKRAEIDNVIGMVRNSRAPDKSAAELAALVKEELVNIAERYKRQTVSAAPKKAPKAKKAD
jgi:hypothetical protein